MAFWHFGVVGVAWYDAGPAGGVYLEAFASEGAVFDCGGVDVARPWAADGGGEFEVLGAGPVVRV